MRNWQPFINDALAALLARGVDAGHRHSAGAAVLDAQRAEIHRCRDARAAGRHALRRGRVVSRAPAAARGVRRARPRRAAAADEHVVFTAHALPVRVIEAGDPYADEVAATARGVATRAGIARYELAFQSAGRTPEPWIGPDARAISCATHRRRRRRASSSSSRSASSATTPRSCSTSTSRQRHARARPRRALRRTESLNTSPTFIALLEVARAAERL